MVSKAVLVGRIGQDPRQGNSCILFSVATSEKWTSKDGAKQELVSWHSCIAFGKLSEIIIKYSHKGDLVYVSGSLRNNKKDNTTYTNVIVNEFKILYSKSAAEPAKEPVEPTEPIIAVEPDLPF